MNPDLMYACQRCFAAKLGEWPHPHGEPCPAVVAVDAAYLGKLEADRAAAEATREAQEAMRDYYTRAQMPMLDTGEAMRALTKALEDE